MHKQNIFDLFNEQNKPQAVESVPGNVVTTVETQTEIVTPDPEPETQPTKETVEIQETITPGDGEKGESENGV